MYNIKLETDKYSDHSVLKVNNMYIDIRGIFLSDDELLNEPIIEKTCRNIFESTKPYSSYIIIKDEEASKIEDYPIDSIEYANFITDLIIEKIKLFIENGY